MSKDDFIDTLDFQLALYRTMIGITTSSYDFLMMICFR